MKKNVGLSSAFGAVVVLCIIGVLNFLSVKSPFKADLTRDKVHSLTDQSLKAVKRLEQPTTFTVFSAAEVREQFRPLLENYKDQNSKITLEFVDMNKELQRVQALGIKKPNTLVVSSGEKQRKVEDINEEKVTNALLGLIENKGLTLCIINGHGERDIKNEGPDGFSGIKQELENQMVTVQELMLPTAKTIPDTCSSILIAGPAGSYTTDEVKELQRHLESGKGAVVALDVDAQGKKRVPELVAWLEKWNVKATGALVLEQEKSVNGMAVLGVADPADFAKSHAIMKDHKSAIVFPFAMALEILPGASPEMHLDALVKTSKSAFAKVDLSSLKKGPLKQSPGDRKGPLTYAIAVEKGKTRLVVLGSSSIGTNQFGPIFSSRDILLNSAAWTLRDEGGISIRAREDEAGTISMTNTQAMWIRIVSVFAVPLLITIGGIVMWWRRKKL